MQYLLGIVEFIQLENPMDTGFEVSSKSGKLFGKYKEMPPIIPDMMLRNYKSIMKATNSVSPEQLAIMCSDSEKNWNKFEMSETWKALRESGVTKEMILEHIQKYSKNNN